MQVLPTLRSPGRSAPLVIAALFIMGLAAGCVGSPGEAPSGAPDAKASDARLPASSASTKERLSIADERRRLEKVVEEISTEELIARLGGDT